MAKKEETISLLDTFQEFKESKNIDRTTMISVLEESFRKVLINIFGTDENYSVIVNPDRGDFEIQRRRIVVADKDAYIREGDIVIGMDGDEATVKRYIKENGRVVFMPENEDFDPIYPENPSILGKVIGSYRKY